jgi:hypothetical protein
MLWMKYWMETRLRLLVACSFFVVILLLGYAQARVIQNQPSRIPAEQRLQAGVMGVFSLFFVMQSVILGGAGIKTQAPFQTTKGLHGSLHFTLSLPVSRLRLLATRMSLGLVELLGAILLGTLALRIILPVQFPELSFSLADFVRYAFTLFACLVASYSISTLFATFLDDVWQAWGSFLLLGALRALTAWLPPPEAIDPFRAIGSGSPLLMHAIPWGAVATSIALAGVLSIAAAKVVQTRDY